MYTLRTIDGDTKLVSNQSLGNDYVVAWGNGPDSLKAFAQAASKCIINENCFAIVTGNNGSIVIPLFNTNEYYIMTESGKTFERL